MILEDLPQPMFRDGIGTKSGKGFEYTVLAMLETGAYCGRAFNNVQGVANLRCPFQDILNRCGQTMVSMLRQRQSQQDLRLS